VTAYCHLVYHRYAYGTSGTFHLDNIFNIHQLSWTGLSLPPTVSQSHSHFVSFTTQLSSLTSHLLPRTEYRGPSNCFSHHSSRISFANWPCEIVVTPDGVLMHGIISHGWRRRRGPQPQILPFSRHLRHLRHFFYFLTVEIQPNVVSMELIHPRVFREISPELILFTHFLQGSFPDIIIHGFHDNFWGKFGDYP